MGKEKVSATPAAASVSTVASAASFNTAIGDEQFSRDSSKGQSVLAPTANRASGQKRKRLVESFEMSDNDLAASKLIVSRLKDLYLNKLLPVERKWGLRSFCLPNRGEIDGAEFNARPMVLVLGQYSTGKTTFIRHLIGGDFPGMHIGPEPTTDRFMVLLQNKETDETGDADESNVNSETEFANRSGKNGVNREAKGTIIKGNTLTVLPELPFSSLSAFGSSFLNHFEGSATSAPLLKHVTLIDTPGILSGEKQYLKRTYNFAKVAKWFADRADLIILIFDANKLDVSDEFQDIVDEIRRENDDKIRCVLNKADGVNKEQLVRVYGSLMWSMGKMFSNPEVMRVYTGSFWDRALRYDDFRDMFEADEWKLTHELVNLPSTSAERKLNQMVKRIRLVKVHVCILGYLKQEMPLFFARKKRAQEDLIANLDKVFDDVVAEHDLSRGDMPDVNEFSACLKRCEDCSRFPSVDKRTLDQLDHMIQIEIPNLIEAVGGLTGRQPQTSSSETGKKGKRQALNRVAKKIKAGFALRNTPGTEPEVDGEKVSTKKTNFSGVFVRIFLLLLGVLFVSVMIKLIVPIEFGDGSSLRSFFDL